MAKAGLAPILIVAGMMLAACETDRQAARDLCKGDPGWSLLAQAPVDADNLRVLADANPVFAGKVSVAWEGFYLSKTGARRLCRADTMPRSACVTALWTFSGQGDEARVTATNGWICVD